MDTEPEKPKSSLPPPNIPRPDLGPPAPSPRSPLDGPAAAPAPADPVPPDPVPPDPVPPDPVPPDPAPAPAPAGEPAKVKLHVAAESAEPLELPGDIAPFNPRIIAALIDGVLSVGLALGVVWILPDLAEGIGWLVGIAYLVTRDSLPFLEGQSVGKKAMSLKAVTLSGASLAGNWEPGLIRNAVLAIPLFPLIELFILLTREEKPERGRRLGDEWAKTKVIVVSNAPSGE